MDRKPHGVLWRRLDLPGHEACRLIALAAGWRISGTAVFDFEGQACQARYEIACDARWRTLSTVVTGWVGAQDVEIEVTREEPGLWMLNGHEIPAVAGALDVDLNFSPSTNTLPIRRLGLQVGQSAAVRAAWLRFPSFALEPLEQSYARLDTNLYHYESAGGRFVAMVEVDELGLVSKYGEIWEKEEPRERSERRPAKASPAAASFSSVLKDCMKYRRKISSCLVWAPRIRRGRCPPRRPAGTSAKLPVG